MTWTLAHQHRGEGLGKNPQTRDGEGNHQRQHRQLTEHRVPTRRKALQRFAVGHEDADDVAENDQADLGVPDR